MEHVTQEKCPGFKAGAEVDVGHEGVPRVVSNVSSKLMIVTAFAFPGDFQQIISELV